MAKTAFLFPGQGSQEVGMARDLFRDDLYFRSLIQLGSDLAHEDLTDLCLKGPEKQMMQARFLQPLLAAVCLGYHKQIINKGIAADVVLGHSLGEITSLAAAGVVSDEDAIRIAAKRGELMDAMARQVNGGMMAVLFVPLQKVEELLGTLNAPHRIVLANDNADNQIVVSGDAEMLDAFAAIVRGQKLGKCMRLVVAGPWHSPYMKDARVQFEEWVDSITSQGPHVPILLNSTTHVESYPTTIRHLITWQLTSPVFWRGSMATLRAMGVDTIVEIGPGRILSGLARVNGFRTGTRIYNANNLQGVEKAASDLSTIPAIRLSPVHADRN